VNNLIVAPLLAVLVAWTMALAPSSPGREPAAGVAPGKLPQLVVAPTELAQVAEAGNCPELAPPSVTGAPRACTSSAGSARLPAAQAGRRAIWARLAGTGDHTPLYFGSLPPPA
jgi:hypothetical protein